MLCFSAMRPYAKFLYFCKDLQDFVRICKLCSVISKPCLCYALSLQSCGLLTGDRGLASQERHTQKVY